MRVLAEVRVRRGTADVRREGRRGDRPRDRDGVGASAARSGNRSSATSACSQHRHVLLVEHPEVDALRFDVIEALIGTGATVSVNALEGAYYWER
ncbi:MAG: hypothetical protein ACLTSX_12600 [Collinsella sp.]